MKHLTKRVAALFLAVALVLGVFPVMASAETVAVEISSLEQITDMAGSYILTADVTATAPIGSSSNPFTGSFDGNGYTVTVTITGTADYTGLFAKIGNGGVVKNFKIKDSAVSSTFSYTGLVAGDCYGTVSDVVAENSAVKGYRYLGGLVGYQQSGATITSCAMEGGSVEKTATDYSDNGIGGIVGENYGTVSLCSNSAKIVNSAGGSNCGYFGGVVGRNNGKISDCYNCGALQNSAYKMYYAAGITARSYGTVENCHNIGAISSNAGSIYGVTSGATNSYYLSGCGATSGGTAKTADEFKTLAESLGENWVDGTDGYPVLSWQSWKYSTTAVKYTVEHYTEDLTGGTYTLYSAAEKKAEPDAAVSAAAAALEGFTFDAENAN